MSTIYFSLAAITGFTITGGVLTYFNKRGNLSHNRHALILSIGFFITWLASFFAPFLATETRIPENGTIAFGIALSTFTGLLTFIIVRVILFVRERNK